MKRSIAVLLSMVVCIFLSKNISAQEIPIEVSSLFSSSRMSTSVYKIFEDGTTCGFNLNLKTEFPSLYPEVSDFTLSRVFQFNLDWMFIGYTLSLFKNFKLVMGPIISATYAGCNWEKEHKVFNRIVRKYFTFGGGGSVVSV